LSRFSVSRVSVFGTGRSLIPTIWGLIWDFTFHPGRGSWTPGRPVAWLPGCCSPEVQPRATTF
jgi:hypothetical protein